MEPMQRPGLPVCIITGFLGTGKTTLLNHILQNQQGRRVAVFVNEFGSVDIDGDLIGWKGQIDEARVITLDNGCMCCEVNDDLQRQLRRVLEAQKHSPELDLLVIETSGLCDPAPVLSTLEQLEDLAVSLHLDSVVTVVDASDLEGSALKSKSAEALCLQDTAAQQIKYCDLILLNKCDLLGGLNSERVAQLQDQWADTLSKSQENPPRILCCEHGAVDLALISNLEGDKDDSEMQKSAKKRRVQETSNLKAYVPQQPPSCTLLINPLIHFDSRNGSRLADRRRAFVAQRGCCG